MASLRDTQETFSRWLLTNRVFAWNLTALVLFAMTTAVPQSIVDEAEPTAAWVPILAVIAMAYGALLAVLYPRVVRSRAHEVLGISWAIAMTPALIGLVMAMLGAGRWLPGLGWLLAIAGLFVAMRRAGQSADASGSAPI